MSPKDIGIDKFKKIVTGGEGEMPGFSDLPAHYLDALAAYISNPTAAGPATRRAGAGGGMERLPRPQALHATLAITKTGFFPVTVYQLSVRLGPRWSPSI